MLRELVATADGQFHLSWLLESGSREQKAPKTLKNSFALSYSTIIMPNVKRFARYANQLERLVASAANGDLSEERKQQIALALDGGPTAKLKQLESIEHLRQSGAFFTGTALAKQLVRTLIPQLINGVSVHDFACGTGNLLTACAYHLPTSGDLQQTLKLWGEYLGGNDIHEEFVRVARARLVLVAVDRGVTGLAPAPKSIFPRVTTADGFDQALVAKPQCITLNPPFTMTVAPTDCTWAAGQYVFVNPDTGMRYTDVKKSFSAACRQAGITDFRFHDLRHTFGTRLADAGVDVVKIKELMGHASIVTTMRYIHATDQGKRGAIVVLSEYRQRHCRKFVAKEKRQTIQPAASR